MSHIGSRFALPENPILRAYESCGGLGILPQGGGLGVFAPYDPSWRANREAMGLAGLADGLGDLGDCGCGCKGKGGAGSCQDDSLGIGMSGLSGLGDFSLDTLMEPSPVMGIPWMYLAVGGLVAFMMFSRVDSSEYKYEKAKARRTYSKRLRSLKEEYPSRGRHAYQHATSFF